MSHTKPSGAKLVTGAVKRFRLLQNEASSADSDLLSALWSKELDYLFLMLVTQLHNIDNMILNHEEDALELIALLRTSNVPAHISLEQITSDQANVDLFGEIAMSLRQLDDVSLPKVVGHDGELNKGVSSRFAWLKLI